MPPPAPPGHAEVLADLDVAAAVGLMGAPAAEVPGWCTPSTADALRRSQARPGCLGCFSLVISFSSCVVQTQYPNLLYGQL